MENMSESVVEEAVRAMLIEHAPDDARPAACAAVLAMPGSTKRRPCRTASQFQVIVKSGV